MAMTEGLLPLVQKVEGKYGSVTKAPDNDPTFMELQKVSGANAEFVQTKEEAKIRDLIIYGYKPLEIEKMGNYTVDQVTKVRKANHLSYKPNFKYMLIKDNLIYYVTNLSSASSILGVTIHDIKRLKDYVAKNGYNLTDIDFHWGDLPDNTRYVLTDCIVRVKHGLESYLKG